MPDQAGNETPDTPDVSESEVRRSTVEELRREAQDAGVSETSGTHEDELVDEVVAIRQGSGTGAPTAARRPLPRMPALMGDICEPARGRQGR